MHEKCHVGMECVTWPECARVAKTEHKGSDAQVSIVAAAGPCHKSQDVQA